MIIDDEGNERYGCIYGISIDPKCESSFDFYVGQTINFNKRRKEHFRAKDKTTRIDRAIFKYGNNNFEMFVIEYCDSLEEMNDAEEFHIAYNKSIGVLLYNIAKGGNNKRMAESTKEKLRQANLGKTLSEEHKANISKNSARRKMDPVHKEKLRKLSTGRIPSQSTKDKIGKGNKGKIQTAEAKEKIGNSSRGRKYSDEIKQKFADFSGSNKPIISIDQFGNKINFLSMTKANKFLNISYVGVKKVLRKQQFITSNYTFVHEQFSEIMNNIEQMKILSIDEFGNKFEFNNIKAASEILNINYAHIFSTLYNTECNCSKIIDGYIFIFSNDIRPINEILSNFINKDAVSIISIDIIGNELVFKSIVEAGRVLGISAGNIGAVLRNERKAASGYTFKYAN